jgi:YidC/Oxa1 family membrane protein insertase
MSVDLNDPKTMLRGQLLVALVISLIVITMTNHFVTAPVKEAQRKHELNAQAVNATGDLVPETARADVIASTQRILIDTPKVKGSISLTGARLDDLTLKNYFTTVKDDKNVDLLTPPGAKHAYYVEQGWIAKDSTVKVPNAETIWSLAEGSASQLTPETPVTLQYDNGQGLIFKRVIKIDENYLFTVTQSVENKSERAVHFFPYVLTSQHGKPVDYAGFGILHEGPIAYVAGQLYEEKNYADYEKGQQEVILDKTGWSGITNKYWMVGLIPPQDQVVKTTMQGIKKNDFLTLYQVDMVGEEKIVQPQAIMTYESHIYAGAKEYKLIQAYEQSLSIPHFDLMIDFGMWYFLTKPLFHLLNFLSSTFGNVAIAILVLTVIVKAALFPLSNKSFKSMAAMKKIQPDLQAIQDKYKGSTDRQALQKEILELYTKSGVNPFNGCWPILLQIPIFFSLYKVIMINIELRHAPFWGWIEDMAAADPTNIFTLFGLLSWTPPSFMHLGLWPLIMGFTMLLQYKMSPQPTDPNQAALQKIFPVMIVFLMANFAAGLVIYWSWSNILSAIQQYIINKRMGIEVSLFGGSDKASGSK